MADIHKYQQHRSQNPLGKHTKCRELMSTTTNCRQYLPGMTMTKKKKKEKKNLSGTLTESGKSTTIKKTHQPEGGKKAIKKKRKKRKKTDLKPMKPPEPLHIPLKCKDCNKKLFSIEAWIVPDKDYWTCTYYYYKPYHRECYGYPKCQDKWNNKPCLTCGKQLLDEGIWNNIPSRGGTCDASCQYMILISDWMSHGTPITTVWHRTISCLKSYPHDEDEIWQMANAKVEGASLSEILEIKNNPPEPMDIVLVLNLDTFLDLENSPEEFYKHYQNLAPIRKKQEQCLEEINTQLCDHCLIPCDFQFCDDCDLIYNPPPCMIYTISKEEESINNCTSESESVFDPNLNSDNDDNENTGSSSIQNGNENISNWDSDSNPEIYIALPDLTKEQTLKWFSNNEEGIMPECVHNTNAGFDLRYPRKNPIKLEPHLHTCIDLKIALKIPATTMVQLASRSNLAKKKITIKRGIINTRYVRNIMAILQNNSEKTYIIEPNEKIAQTIFLPLVRVAQLISVRKKKELRITVRGIQGFRSTGRIDIPVNMAEEEIIGQGEIISTGQVISIPPYNQYMVVIERKVKDKDQIFEAETSLCKSGKIELINLHIPAKRHNHIKISIYNTIRDAITIPEKTIIGYMSTELENQPPSIIPDFPQLCEYIDITSQTIYRRNKYYLLQPEQLEQMNMGNLDPLQCMQLKMLLNNFNNIFISENEFGRTDIIQH
ncbi:hypothetical protein G9A89_013953 [Geosiphon pyriformis]|nr:hypothetical protein G9A89_013953 [Geosiphon pyriformis]